MSARKKGTGTVSTREQFLWMVSQVNLIMDKKYYPGVEKALIERNKDAFREIALDAGVKAGVIDDLYKILSDVYMESTKETAIPWMI